MQVDIVRRREGIIDLASIVSYGDSSIVSCIRLRFRCRFVLQGRAEPDLVLSHGQQACVGATGRLDSITSISESLCVTTIDGKKCRSPELWAFSKLDWSFAMIVVGSDMVTRDFTGWLWCHASQHSKSHCTRWNTGAKSVGRCSLDLIVTHQAESIELETVWLMDWCFMILELLVTWNFRNYHTTIRVPCTLCLPIIFVEYYWSQRSSQGEC